MANKHSCRKYIYRIDDYIDGFLEGKELEDFDKHLAECEDCREEYRIALALRKMIKRAKADMPEDMHSKIMSSIKNEAAPAKKNIHRRAIRSAALSAACMLIFLSLGAVLWLLPMHQMSNSEMADGATSSIYNEEAEADKDDEALATNDMQNSVASDHINTSSPDKAQPEAETAAQSASTATNETIHSSSDDQPTIDPAMTEANELPDAAEEVTAIPETNAVSPAPPPSAEGNEDTALDHNKYPDTEAPSNSSPGGEEITLALLIVSGLLAVASFIAFLISLSSVRKLPEKKKDEDKE